MLIKRFRGARKTASASTYTKPGKPDVVINGLSYNQYIKDAVLVQKLENTIMPLIQDRGISVLVSVKGGGFASQLDACLRSIIRCLDESLSLNLRSSSEYKWCFNHDPRQRERTKLNRQGPRRGAPYNRR